MNSLLYTFTARLGLTNISLLLMLCVVGTQALAIDPNSTEAIEIESDSASLSEKSGTSIYEGNVTVKQGKTNLTADKIEVYTQEKRLTRIIASGSPAQYTQQHQDDEVPTIAIGNQITYIAEEGLLKMQENARLQQAQNSFEGNEIEYDIANRAVRASGDDATNSKVKITYQPPAPSISEETETQPAAENAPAPAPSPIQE